MVSFCAQSIAWYDSSVCVCSLLCAATLAAFLLLSALFYIERTVVGVAPWRILSSYVKLLVGVSLKAQDHVIIAHLPSL